MIGYESGVGASGDFAARRFDEDYGWQDPVVLPEFAPDGEVLSFSTAPDGSMLGMVQHGPYGSYFAYGIVYR